MTKRSKRFWFIILILVCFGSAVGLSLFALKDRVSYFYTPQELTTETIGKHIRLGGVVKSGSVKKRSDTGVIQFIVRDDVRDVPVTYGGVLPDLFREGQTIVADGIWDGDVFQARIVLAKHDENYKPPEMTNKFKNREGME